MARFEEKTAEANGRIYLAKDALSGPAAVCTMYSEHADWLKAVSIIALENSFETDPIRRLKLRDAT